VDATSITGSNQIEQIRASQIEDRNITNGSGYYTTLSVDSGFSTGIFDGAVYLIKSVGSTNILSTADPYRCLALSETSPGIVEILGVEYNTGIDYYVDTGYNSLPNPINSGDGSYIYPPYGISSTRITGALIDNSPFDYIKYSWFNNDNNNPTIFSHFEVVMSKDGIPFYTGQSVDTFYNQNVNYTGIYNANIRSVSKGGVYSDPISWNHTISELNFHGGITLGYLNIISGNDPRLNNTGYFGNSITLNWTLPTDNNGLYDTQARFITGYEFNILDANSNAPLITPVYISGVNNRTYTISSTQMYGLNTRRFKPYIRVKDIDGNYSSGIASILNNAAPTIANLAQFYAVSGSLNYSISPNDIDQYDISGVNIWTNQSIGYSPSFSSPTFSSRVLGGVLNTNLTGQYYAWYSLIDTYGIGGCTINGPYAVTGQSLQGAAGNYVKRIYQRNFATPTTPNPTDVSPAGWYTDIPAGNDAVWVTEATINAENTSVIIPWYAPKRLSGNVNFYQPTQPDPGSYNLMNGDMWWDTSNNYKLYRYNGSSWVGAFTPFLASNGGGNITGVVTVGETGKPFVILTDAFQVWNGSSSESPFEIIGGKVYINTGYVRELTFGRIVGGTATAQELIIADSGPTHGIFRSQNYSSGVAGVCLRGDGYFEANNALIRGTLDIGTGVYHTVISDNLIQQGVMKISGGYNFYGGETNMMLNGGLGYLKIGGNNYAADLPAFLIGYKNYADSDPSFNINTWGQMGCKSMSVRQFTNDIETELSVYSRGTNTNARSTIILKNSDDNYGGGIVRISGVMSANSSNVKYFQGTNSNNNTFQIGTLSNNEVEFGANGNIGFRLRTDNNIQNWWPVMDKNGNQILADARYGSTPTNVSEIVACLQYHGLC
jgi:hypothetical protein